MSPARSSAYTLMYCRGSMKDSSKQRWRIISTGSESAWYQMALDEVLVRAFAEGRTPPVFRIYRWRGPAITFGYAQRPAGYLDLGKCADDGIEVTRRLTGGRAVFHVNELGYAVIGSTSDPVFGGSIRQTYRSVHAVIAGGFRSACRGALIEGKPRGNRLPHPYRHIAPCFALPTPFELTLDGRKVVGSAQRRFRGVFLQQGSIRLGPGAGRIVDYLLDREAADFFQRELFRGEKHHEVMDKGEYDRLTDALFHAFRERIELEPERDGPGGREHGDALRLCRTRYHNREWIVTDGRPDF